MANDKELAPLYETLFELAIVGLTSHYASPGYITESSVNRAARNTRLLVKRTADKFDFRSKLGTSVRIWQKLSLCIAYANDSLEDKSIPQSEPPEDLSKATLPQSSALLNHYATLVADLERLNDVIMVARNIVASGEEAQNLASESKFDQEIVKLVELCVRCSAGGYDGPVAAGPNDTSEEKWKKAVLAFKLLLKTSLEFLHSMVLGNEKRKLMLWMDLFGSPPDPHQPPFPIPQSLQAGSLNGSAMIEVSEGQQQSLQAFANAVIDATTKQPGVCVQENLLVVPEASMSKKTREISAPRQPMNSVMDAKAARDRMRDSYFQAINDRTDPAMSLREAREEVDRLERIDQEPLVNRDDQEEDEDEEENDEAEEEGEDAELEEEEEEDPEGYEDSRFGERGILTEIPLVLNPTEIVALPMILHAGMVHSSGNDHSLASVRTNILLAQEVGKAVLRECLVYIAAWNIAEDDQYYGTMQEVVGAILDDGLLPYAYTEFMESKPIMSPAQLVLVKLLTSLFYNKIENNRRSPASGEHANRRGERIVMGPPPPPSLRPPISKTDLTMIRFIFTKFRMDVVPHVCVIIEMQEQVKRHQVAPEDFPLTQWDMDRVYEGVFQFLDLLSVLAGSEQWRKLLVEWDCCFEMVSLLASLERIPDSLSPDQQQRADRTKSGHDSQTRVVATPVRQEQLVETPYSLDPPQNTTPPLASSVLEEGPASWLIRAPSEVPSDFGWRNLKKLVILVIATLVYINPEAQDSVRSHGGIELITRACQFEDTTVDDGGAVKDYGQLCLNYLMEEHSENKAWVEQLRDRKKQGQTKKSNSVGRANGMGGPLPLRGRMMEML